MTKSDARKLNHKTLEEIRIRAVEQVQTGQSPELVIKALGFSRSCIYDWLARDRIFMPAELGRPGVKLRWLR